MSIGTTYSETAYRGGDGFHDAQGRGGQDAAVKGGVSVLYLKGNMSVGRLVGFASEDGEGEHKGGTEGVARFPALATGGQMTTGTSGR